MSITILYVILILCTVTLIVAVGACYVHVRKHMKHPAPSETMKQVALHEQESQAVARSER